MRLVDEQDHDLIAGELHQYLLKLLPKQASLTFTKITGSNAVITNTDSIAYKAACRSLENVFSVKPTALAIGGTIPIVSIFNQHLNIEPLLMGFWLR